MICDIKKLNRVVFVTGCQSVTGLISDSERGWQKVLIKNFLGTPAIGRTAVTIGSS